MDSWLSFIQDREAQLTTTRIRIPKTEAHNRYLVTDQGNLLNFVSNDYLGLSTNKQIIESFVTACNRYGLGSTGAPSLSGYSEEHMILAEHMATWLDYNKCLLFSSGYQLNLGLFSQLTDNETHIWLDKNCHASHIDGILLSRCKFTTFNTNNIDQITTKIKNTPNYRHLILSEGGFSMDGTCDYWHKLIQLKSSNPKNILLVIDDAHGIGALGNHGHGTLEQLNLDHKQVDLMIGTFGKAFGTHGGFICGNTAIINYLQQTVRSQIFSTNLPPAIAAASKMSLQIISSTEGQQLRLNLAKNIAYFKETALSAKLNLTNYSKNNSPIQLLVHNNQESIIKAYHHLLNNNIIVGRILYPTVAKDTPRIRISINAHHTHDDLDKLINHLAAMEYLK